MQSHHLEKIVISTGLGKMRQNNAQFEEKVLPEVIHELGLIAGQRPAVRPAKKSIAAFKMRAGDVIGVSATLRGKRMDDFFNRLTSIVLPRVRDFRGIRVSQVDSSGNLTIGLREHTVFPEINPETSKVNFGVEMTFVADTKTREEGIQFFRDRGMPMEKK